MFEGAASLGEQFNSYSASVSAVAAGTETAPDHGNSVRNQPDGKNPVMILNDIRPGTQYDLSETLESDNKNFVMSVSAQKVVKGDRKW